jgi:hypothetical protein
MAIDGISDLLSTAGSLGSDIKTLEGVAKIQTEIRGDSLGFWM